jgi:hypothetical protein
MSYVVAAPDAVSAAAQDLSALHSTLSQASATAAGPTAGMVAPAADQVSAGVARLFGAFGQDYQAIAAQTEAFHLQFVNLLNAGASAYTNAEAANAQQIVANAVNAPAKALLGGENIVGVAAGQNAGAVAVADAAASGNSIVAPYERLLSNTAVNMQSISNAWANVTEPALLQTVTTQLGSPQLIANSLQTGNPLPLLSIPAKIAQGYVNVMRDLTVPLSSSISSVGPTNASLAVGVGLPQLLASDALGAPVNGALALQSSSTAFFGGLQAGNPAAAATTLVDAPACVANAFLNGEATGPLGLPLSGLSASTKVTFGGLLAPVHPLSARVSLPGSPLIPSPTITGPRIGGLG